MASTDFAIAFLAGLIPILFWLWFWLHEDRQRPEPIILIIITFLAGMMVVPIALPLQKMAIDLYTGNNVMFVWVIIEEVLKYFLYDDPDKHHVVSSVEIDSHFLKREGYRNNHHASEKGDDDEDNWFRPLSVFMETKPKPKEYRD